MSRATLDNLEAVVGLVIFLVVAYWIGSVINRFKFARFAQAWAPLIPIIQGTISNEEGGAATSWLSGTYQGREVRASMVPGRNRYSSGNGGSGRYNYFDIQIRNLPGARDWKIEYHQALLSFGKLEWRIVTDDHLLEKRLQDSDLVAMVARMGEPIVSYREAPNILMYSEEVTPLWAPSPERFQKQLDLLVRLAALNEDVNPPS